MEEEEEEWSEDEEDEEMEELGKAVSSKVRAEASIMHVFAGNSVRVHAGARSAASNQHAPMLAQPLALPAASSQLLPLLTAPPRLMPPPPSHPSQGAAASAPAGKRGMLGSFVSSLAMRVAGKSALSQEDLAPALEGMKRKLMERNVAEEIAGQICDSVARSLEGKSLSSFTGACRGSAPVGGLKPVVTPWGLRAAASGGAAAALTERRGRGWRAWLRASGPARQVQLLHGLDNSHAGCSLPTLTLPPRRRVQVCARCV